MLSYGVELSGEEKEFLKMPKSATDFVKIDEEKMKTSIQVMAAKLRMSLKEVDEEGQRGAQGAAARPTRCASTRVPQQGANEDEEEAMMASKRIFDVEEGSVDFRKKRVTDMVTCKRIQVPDAAEAAKEAKIKSLSTTWKMKSERMAREKLGA